MTTKQRQNLLQYLGYYSGIPDDVYGPMTKKAVEDFQRDFGTIGVDGVAGAETDKALRHAVAYGMPEDGEPDEGQAVKPQTGTFWDGIKHFTRTEFKCKCGGRFCNGYPAEMQEAVVKIADAARAHFGKPAHVVSGLRCQQWNAHEGGVANSQHMYGEAIDLRIDGVDSETLRRFVASQPGHRYSYCINSTNVHFDINKVGR